MHIKPVTSVQLTESFGEIPNRSAEDSVPVIILGQDHELVLLSWRQVVDGHLRYFREFNRSRVPLHRVHQTVPDVVLNRWKSHTWKGERIRFIEIITALELFNYPV